VFNATPFMKDIDNDLLDLPLQNIKSLGEHNEFPDIIKDLSEMFQMQFGNVNV